MIAPLTAEIRSWSKVSFDDLEYEAPSNPTLENPDPLDVLVGRSLEYVLDVTGRTLEDIPITLEWTAKEAIQRRVEQLAFQATDDHVETVTDEMVKSFGAGNYNEARREILELSPKKSKHVNPWHLLHDLLWRLMTEEKREWWEEQMGDNKRPAWEITETDWSAGDYLPSMSDEIFGA